MIGTVSDIRDAARQWWHELRQKACNHQREFLSLLEEVLDMPGLSAEAKGIIDWLREQVKAMK